MMLRPFALGCLAAAAAAACGDKAIEVKLIAPAGETAQGIDYGCVDHIETIMEGSGSVPTISCVAIAPGTITNLRDHHLGDLLDVPIPQGFSQMSIRGVRSDDACAGDSVFHGFTPYQGGDRVELPLVHALDCRAFTSAPSTVKLLDLQKFVQAAADRCAPVAAPTDVILTTTLLLPVDIDGRTFYATDPSSAPIPVDATGTASIAGPHFAGALEPSCLAITSDTPIDSPWSPGGTCFAPPVAPFRTLCGGSTDELLIMPEETGFEIEQLLGVGLNSAAAVGFVWDSQTGRPLSGATVTRLTGTAAGFRQVYFDLAANGTVTPAGAATTGSGLFAIETFGPTTVVVQAPGRASRRVVLADALYPSVQAIELRPQ